MLTRPCRLPLCCRSLQLLQSMQIKRIHEYKRQLLNVLGIIHRYDAIKKMSAEQRSKLVPRVCIIGGKVGDGGDDCFDAVAGKMRAQTSFNF